MNKNYIRSNIKITKYILRALLIVIALTFIGELYIWHISDFETKYSGMTFYLQKGTSQEKMVADFYAASDKTEVEVFTVIRTVNSSFSEKVDIYGTRGVKNYLKKDADIEDGQFESVFLGKTDVKFHPLEEIPDISKIETYKAIGKENNLIAFKQELVDQYAGAFPEPGYASSNEALNVGMIWAVILTLFLLSTLYRTALLKKEVIIRIVSGERLTDFMFSKALTDTAAYILIFIIAIPAMCFFTKADYKLHISIFCIIIFLVINAAAYGLLLFTNYKKDMSGKDSARKILKVSYLYKTLSVAVVLMMLSGTAGLIYQGAMCFQQRDFFKEQSGRSYIMLSSLDDKKFQTAEAAWAGLYRQQCKEGKALTLVELEDFESGDSKFIYADSGAIPYLRQAVPSLKDADFKQGNVYIVSPEGTSEAKLKSAENTLEAYYDKECEAEHVSYSGHARVVGLRNDGEIRSTLKKDPVILLNNDFPGAGETDVYITQSTMFDLTSREWDRLVKENGLEGEIVYRTDVYDNYLHQWELMKRGLLIGIVLVGILLLLEGLLINTVLYYEYYVHAEELSLKKIMGYGLFERNKKIFKLTGICGGISLIIAAAAAWFTETAPISYMVLAGGTMLFVELLLVIRHIVRLERVGIQKILKGGSI
ncbi:hypothetical protein NE619_16945 [Anaerovorax odorimutans]|uniref:Bacteriocin-associated integral membrane protein n=1 Tax=Anaerovorax odorimutans TaxID=109327 RepID=A0ABT1RT91_9FIRM|nr:hypothetical protein [Anaerovorax odorimutans]MCQ4638420.1 hypothetical protein [Anaerovorax odorimutans]